jgi:hypothetical protein
MRNRRHPLARLVAQLTTLGWSCVAIAGGMIAGAALAEVLS